MDKPDLPDKPQLLDAGSAFRRHGAHCIYEQGQTFTRLQSPKERQHTAFSLIRHIVCIFGVAIELHAHIRWEGPAVLAHPINHVARRADDNIGIARGELFSIPNASVLEDMFRPILHPIARPMDAAVERNSDWRGAESNARFLRHHCVKSISLPILEMDGIKGAGLEINEDAIGKGQLPIERNGMVRLLNFTEKHQLDAERRIMFGPLGMTVVMRIARKQDSHTVTALGKRTGQPMDMGANAAILHRTSEIRRDNAYTRGHTPRAFGAVHQFGSL